VTESFRVIALDIDGTILDFDEGLSQRVRDAVRAVDAAPDRQVVLSTGRALAALMPILARLGLSEGYAVTSNGSVTVRLDPASPGGYQVIDLAEFDPARALLMVREHLPDALYAVEDDGLGYRLTAPFPQGELIGELTYVPFEELLHRPVTRVVVRSPEHSTEDFLELVERLGMAGASYAVGWTAWLDIAPDGVSKARGLQVVVDALGLAAADVMAVGDGRNDLEMFAWAGRSVAMGQAPAEVRDAADEVCGDVTSDGLADVLVGGLAWAARRGRLGVGGRTAGAMCCLVSDPSNNVRDLEDHRHCQRLGGVDFHRRQVCQTKPDTMKLWTSRSLEASRPAGWCRSTVRTRCAGRGSTGPSSPTPCQGCLRTWPPPPIAALATLAPPWLPLTARPGACPTPAC
jgi:hydroxymethylpyrimidine pyrophosphatase-like HAD family hydrolase